MNSLELEIRYKRNMMLNECDKWLQISQLSSRLTPTQSTNLITFMQSLRDWPQDGLPSTKWIQPSTPTVEECGVDFSIILYKINK
jgi:hypothetical protein